MDREGDDAVGASGGPIAATGNTGADLPASLAGMMADAKRCSKFTQIPNLKTSGRPLDVELGQLRTMGGIVCFFEFAIPRSSTAVLHHSLAEFISSAY
jgi:hypothetical protein